jgi:acyl carrier protein
MNDLKAEIKRLIIDTLGLEDLTPEDIADDSPLFGEGLGLDSIDALELGVALRKRYRISLDAGDSAVRDAFRCVNDLTGLVHARRGSAA